MIQIVVQKKRGERIGFRSRGHAGYADAGSDIICAAVSVLELNLANSVDSLTDARFTSQVDEKNGTFSFRLADRKNKEAVLLLDSCLLGFSSIREEYGGQYLSITDEEV